MKLFYLFPKFDVMNSIPETKKKTEPNSIFMKMTCNTF